MRSFVKINPSRSAEVTQLFTDIGKSCPSHEFLALQICLLMLFAKIKFSQKFPNLQYRVVLGLWFCHLETAGEQQYLMVLGSLRLMVLGSLRLMVLGSL